MADFRLVGARVLACKKEAWREPATLFFYTRLLQNIIDEEGEDPSDRAEAEYLIKKLYAAGKRPPLA
jgi:hypothetical protein